MEEKLRFVEKSRWLSELNFPGPPSVALSQRLHPHVPGQCVGSAYISRE